MENKDIKKQLPQHIILENRKHLTISGVEDMINFDENTISVITNLGNLLIKGSDLKINTFSVEIGDIIIDGNIDNISYTNNKKSNSKNFWSNLGK